MKRAINYAKRVGKFILHAAVGCAVIALVSGSWIAIGSIFTLQDCAGPRWTCTLGMGFLVTVCGAFVLAIVAALGRVTLSYIDDKVDDFKAYRRTKAYRRSIAP